MIPGRLKHGATCARSGGEPRHGTTSQEAVVWRSNQGWITFGPPRWISSERPDHLVADGPGLDHLLMERIDPINKIVEILAPGEFTIRDLPRAGRLTGRLCDFHRDDTQSRSP